MPQALTLGRIRPDVFSYRIHRDVTIDVMRGLAIFIMVTANMALLLEPPFPALLRLYASLAVPIFILGTGMLIGWAHIAPQAGRGLWYYTKRAGFMGIAAVVLGVTASVTLHFETIDALVFIIALIPLMYFLAAKPLWVSWAFAAAVFAVTFWLQSQPGYVELFSAKHQGDYTTTAFWLEKTRVFFVEGCYAFFPWAGYMALGITVAQLRWKGFACNRFMQTRWLAGSMATMAAGLYLFMAQPQFYTALPHTQFTYPPGVAPLMINIGFTLMMFSMIDRTRGFVGWQLFRCLGEAPLLMYMLNIWVIALILHPVFGTLSLSGFAMLNACFLLWLLCMGWTMRITKNAMPTPKHTSVRWLLNGLEA